ncbi:MAG: farnesyl diphosphate synthase [Candidatus Sericytochromatia bacterium]
MENKYNRLEEYLAEKKQIVDQALENYVPDKKITKVWDSMRYSLKAGGKRLRPVLTIAVSELFNTPLEYVLPTACAIEMIHTQSLIHDDLPGMDNDDLRRGKPTNHVVFGEAIAIIAGDALFAQAFYTISKQTPKEVNPENIIKVMVDLSHSSGPDGMCGGQAMDITLEKEGGEINDAVLQYIHTHKTGDMIRTSVRCGAILSNATQEQLNNLTMYSENIGLAFQIVDDILDITGETKELGKTTGKDVTQNKVTYPRLYGLEESRKMAERCIENAINNLESFGEKAYYLKLLAEYILNRKS